MEGDDTVDALTATVSRLAAKHAEATHARDAAQAKLRDAVVQLMAADPELSEVKAAKLAGISRQTLRVWTEKDKRWPPKHGTHGIRDVSTQGER